MKRVFKNTPVKLFLLSAILLICSQAIFATTVIIPSDDSLVIESRAIVRGRILSIGTAYDEARRRVYTYITLRVQEVIKGQIRERKIVIKEEGGQTAEFGTLIYGAPRFTPDQNVILYLDTWGDGSYRTRHLYLGKYNIVTDAATGEQTVVRETMDEGVRVLQNIGEHANEQKTEQMELKSFLRMLRSKTAAFRAQSQAFEEMYFAGIPKLPEPPEYDQINRHGRIQTQWAYISSAHPSWFEIYDGQPVTFYVNTAGAPNSTVTNDIQAAMNAWSTISGSALRVVLGGTTSDCWTDSANNVINFNNCDGRWSGGGCQGVLALGGLSWFPSQTRVINGITFTRGTDGFVSFNPFAACNFGNSCNVQEITTHELGHALGLGHSAVQDATMFGIAHFDGRCASLRQDDMDGMRTIYPATGGGGGGPLSIVSTSPLASATTNVAYSQTLLAAGGSTPYSWSIVSGSLPAGLSLNTTTGVISGTPTTAGTANFTAQVRDGAQATAQKAFALTVSNGGSQYSSQFISQTVPSSVAPGQQFSVNMKFLNNGTQPWITGGAFSYYLASQNPSLNQTWGGNGVPLFTYEVHPGEQLDITFLAIAPLTPGNYNFQWQTYQNGGIGYFGEMSQNVVIQVGSAPPPPATNNAEFVSQNVPASMTAGQTYNVSVTMRNSGTTTWSPTSYKLGSQNPQDNTTWGANRVTLASSTAPSTNVTFTFNVTAPNTPGTYNFQWKMNDGSAFFGAASTNVAVNVAAGSGCTVPIPPAPDPMPQDIIWVDDAVPAGAFADGIWNWDTARKVSGTQSTTEPAQAGIHQHYFQNGSPLAVGQNDKLVCYVMLNPCDPPQEIMLQWHDASGWEHRAYWGQNLIPWGANGTAGRFNMGALPATGQWVRLEIPAASVGLAGRVVDGMAFTLYGGQAWFDRAGKDAPTGGGGCTVPVAPPPTSLPQDTIWFDDQLPSGAVADGIWMWDTNQKASGSQSHSEPAQGDIHQHYFYNASPMVVGANDKLVCYVLLSNCDTPRQIMLQWHDASGWEHRAYWGQNLIPWGANGTAGRFNMGALPATGQWVRLEIPAASVGLAGRVVDGMAFSLSDGQAWFDRVGKETPTGGGGCTVPTATPPASFPQSDTVWFDDAIPAGAFADGIWMWDTTQKASGNQSNTEPVQTGIHQHYFQNATQTLTVGQNEKLVCYVLLDPCDPPQEIMLQWHDASGWEHRAYWGQNLIPWGANGTAGRFNMGALPATGQWVRLEIPAASVGLAGRVVDGMAFSLYGGRAWFDRAGKGH